VIRCTGYMVRTHNIPHASCTHLAPRGNSTDLSFEHWGHHEYSIRRICKSCSDSGNYRTHLQVGSQIRF
jgi:hypothetical protein